MEKVRGPTGKPMERRLVYSTAEREGHVGIVLRTEYFTTVE